MNHFLQRLRTRLRRLAGKNARTVWISHPYFAMHNPGRNHPDSPHRIAAIEHELKQQGIFKHLQTAEAEEISDGRLALVHTRNYLQYLENQTPQPEKIRRIDDDTVMCSDSLAAARFAAGAVVQAVDMVMQKKAWNAFCAVRPPGHHAQSGKGGGFCLLNNVAAGAMHAVSKYRLQRIAVIDFDVHFGDGTAEIFADEPKILFFNSFETDLFPFADGQPPHYSDNIVNLPFAAATGSAAFRRAVREKWLPKLAAFSPELVLFSAGFDAHREDESGRLNLHETDFSWLTHKIMHAAARAAGKIVSVLEGGYTIGSLQKSAAEHIRTLAGLGKSPQAEAYRRQLAAKEPPSALKQAV